MKYAALLFLAASACAQDLPSVSPLESFFRTVEYRSRIAETHAIQAALGFTDAEMQSLNTVASAFLNRASILRAPTSEMIFRARLEFADTGQESETVKQQFRAMETELAGALAQAVRELRAALGDEPYQKFDSWLRARGTSGCWVAPCSATPRR